MFDLNPTNPQLDIQPTGKCELRLCKADFLAQPEEAAATAAPSDSQGTAPVGKGNAPAKIPSATNLEVVAVYGPDGRCRGALPPHRAAELSTGYMAAQDAGTHASMTPPAADLATELVGLLERNKPKQGKNKEREVTAGWLPPSWLVKTLQRHTGVTHERYTTPLTRSAHMSSFSGTHPRDAAFGAGRPTSETQHSGISFASPQGSTQDICKAVQHAIHSADAVTAAATFLLLPDHRGRGSTAYMQLLHTRPHQCKLLGTFQPGTLLGEAPQVWWADVPRARHNSAHMHLVVICNEKGRLHIKEHPHSADLCCAIQARIGNVGFATLKRTQDRQVTESPLPGRGTFNKLPLDQARTTLPTPGAQPQWGQELKQKVADWRTLAYTDGSCMSDKEGQRIGAGVYMAGLQAQGSGQHTVNPKGEGLTNTINRAELTGLAAAMQQGYTHIATDSLASLHQIRKAVLQPMTLDHHKHEPLLTSICRMIESSPEPIHFYKVKAHSGIIGNEAADALARWSACAADGHEMGVGVGSRPYENTHWPSSPATKEKEECEPPTTAGRAEAAHAW